MFGRDAAATAGHKAGAAASGAAGTAAGTAQTQAGGVPLWALAAGGAAAGLAIYYGFKASPGSHGAWQNHRSACMSWRCCHVCAFVERCARSAGVPRAGKPAVLAASMGNPD